MKHLRLSAETLKEINMENNPAILRKRKHNVRNRIWRAKEKERCGLNTPIDDDHLALLKMEYEAIDDQLINLKRSNAA